MYVFKRFKKISLEIICALMDRMKAKLFKRVKKLLYENFIMLRTVLLSCCLGLSKDYRSEPDVPLPRDPHTKTKSDLGVGKILSSQKKNSRHCLVQIFFCLG